MIHPILFLQFFRELLAPLHISAAGADAIAYTWLIIALLAIVSIVATKAVKMRSRRTAELHGSRHRRHREHDRRNNG